MKVKKCDGCTKLHTSTIVPTFCSIRGFIRDTSTCGIARNKVSICMRTLMLMAFDANNVERVSSSSFAYNGALHSNCIGIASTFDHLAESTSRCSIFEGDSWRNRSACGWFGNPGEQLIVTKNRSDKATHLFRGCAKSVIFL